MRLRLFNPFLKAGGEGSRVIHLQSFVLREVEGPHMVAVLVGEGESIGGGRVDFEEASVMFQDEVIRPSVEQDPPSAQLDQRGEPPSWDEGIPRRPVVVEDQDPSCFHCNHLFTNLPLEINESDAHVFYLQENNGSPSDKPAATLARVDYQLATPIPSGTIA